MSDIGDEKPEIPDRAPDCLKCRHFRITWEPAFPRSCAVFGIKCRNLPSMEVLLSTGRHCFSFALKEGLK
ncbi:hypothetical protein [Leadbettera azotonutricia]|uniref:Uracil-DNA glycosylase n=1 Tax=Leadbettera azotonutricia (strain ATCC BAA-888 / DSM 13862 / ZAS-9) TaxID=545695 RepID=F5YCQ1_LEAAZ|nr:hypothetical protein [Leadbettera azotonutricia]AEF82392.1 conserved hypothetical protein [Leadbettera azotonutricia ZAS-9]